MKGDRWEGLLDGEAMIDGLARLGARRRFARERAESEDGPDLDLPEEEPVRMAAADDHGVYRDDTYVVELRSGAAIQREGPSGFALRVEGRVFPLVRGERVAVGIIGAPAELTGVTHVGRTVLLRR